MLKPDEWMRNGDLFAKLTRKPTNSDRACTVYLVDGNDPCPHCHVDRSRHRLGHEAFEVRCLPCMKAWKLTKHPLPSNPNKTYELCTFDRALQRSTSGVLS